ncbi:MAG TPA: hypothetical protein DIW50_11695 [Prolixibacteraceae bacterium]|nr:hypothetical protein [Prolixibacteraceae bacterium]
MRNKIIIILAGILLSAAAFQSCKISYSFTGAVPMVGVKTFSVEYIQNRARLINPNLSQQLTEAIQEKLLKQTSFDQIESGGDLEFSGQITGYDVKPMNIQEGDLAAQNRLTVSVKIKYTNNKDHEQDWEKSFSAYEDFGSEISIDQAEGSIVPEIIEKLTDDIFNASIANW